MSKQNKKNAKKQDAVVTEASALPTSTAATDSVATTAKAERKASQKSEKAVAKQVKAAKAAAAIDCRMPAFKHARKKKLSSGKGPSPLEVGQSLVSLFNAGKSEEAESTWYHRKIESIEADGRVFEGLKGVLENGKWWRENFTVLSARAEGPYVCSTGFTVIYSGSARKSNGAVIDLAETGVYTVKKGRIVREQFMRKA